MQQYGHYNAVTIDATFGINENKVSFLFANSIHVSKPRNPLETWRNMFENCWNMLKYGYVHTSFHCIQWWCLMIGRMVSSYVITSRKKQNNLSKWMDAINRKMQESKLDWKSNAFIVDDVKVEINSLRFKCFIFL